MLLYVEVFIILTCLGVTMFVGRLAGAVESGKVQTALST